MELLLIQKKIYEIRGQKVMLDFDLAVLYEVETKALNQAVNRNKDRFPKDFMFRLTRDEYNLLRSQFVTLERGKGKYSKYYFLKSKNTRFINSIATNAHTEGEENIHKSILIFYMRFFNIWLHFPWLKTPGI